MEDICQRMRGGGHHQAVTYGSLDAATGGRILQRLIDFRALTPGMLAAFRGCPVAELSMDRNPRATNALLAELGRKVTRLLVSIVFLVMLVVMLSVVGGAGVGAAFGTWSYRSRCCCSCCYRVCLILQ